MLGQILNAINTYVETCEGKTHLSDLKVNDLENWYSSDVEATKKYINANYTSSTASKITVHTRNQKD